MKKMDIIAILRAFEKELKGFTQTVNEGARVWNGHEYAAAERREADSYALAWWTTARTVADFLEMQDTGLTEKQSIYLRNVFLGGMGSFADFQVDEKKYGEEAIKANNELERLRSRLFDLLKTT